VKSLIDDRRSSIAPWVIHTALVAVLLVTFGLRLAYAFDISPFSDEYITMVAARAVLQTGAPVLPSGLFYDHGILFVYVDALFLGLMGFTVEIARTASVFIGVLTAALVYTVGQRWFTARVGLIAALLLALGPEAIVWHGRARMYSLLQSSFLTGAFLLYEGFVMRNSRLYRCAGVVAIGCAVLSHLLAIPYTVTMVVALAVARKWIHKQGRGFPLPMWRLWPELLLGLTGGGLAALTRSLGGPWGATGRIVTDPALLADVGYLVTHAVAWMRLFLTWPNLIWAAMILAGVLALLLRLTLKLDQQDDLHWVYLLITWLGSVVGLGVFSVWYADNYIIGLLPFFHLLSARELDRLCVTVEGAVERGAGARRVVGWASTVIIAGLVVLLVWPGALKTVTYDPVQLDQALDYVRQHWQEGDTVATYAPHASLITLGRVGFYAQEYGHECTETKTGHVDIWTGTPVLDSVEKLEGVLDTRGRIWLIVHRENWQRDYSTAYREQVEARMVRVWDGTGTVVYLSEP
jgi:4-amino-4-deoxy-L-arabinose transferase-like glycosyltransferase